MKFSLNPFEQLTKREKKNADLHQVIDLDLNKPDENGDTALIHAIDRERLDLVNQLLFHGADVNVTSSFGLSPLEHAQRTGNVSIVKAVECWRCGRVKKP